MAEELPRRRGAGRADVVRPAKISCRVKEKPDMSTPSSSNWWTAMPPALCFRDGQLPENIQLLLKRVREENSTRAAQALFLDRVKQRRRLLAEGFQAAKERMKLHTACAAGSSDQAGWATVLEEFRADDDRLVSEAEAWDEWWWTYGQNGEAFLAEADWLEGDYLQRLKHGMNFMDLRDAIQEIERKQRSAAKCSACKKFGACCDHLWPAETPAVDEAVILALGQDPDYLSWAKDNPSPWDSKLD